MAKTSEQLLGVLIELQQKFKSGELDQAITCPVGISFTASGRVVVNYTTTYPNTVDTVEEAIEIIEKFLRT